VQATVKTHEEQTAAGDLSNSETGDIIDEEDAKMSGTEELEESNVSLFNDSSPEDFDFEEKEPEVGGNIAVEDNAENGPALSEVDEVEQVEANDMDEETRHNGEEEATASKGGATDDAGIKEDQERETEEEILEDVRPTERTSGLLDLKASEYFTKYPKAIANPQERSLKLFNEDAQGLPEGWKVRLLKDPRDEGKTVRHYLSPDMRVLKTGQGVVEYLRLEGSLPSDQILGIAKSVLLLSEKKINALYL